MINKNKSRSYMQLGSGAVRNYAVSAVLGVLTMMDITLTKIQLQEANTTQKVDLHW